MKTFTRRSRTTMFSVKLCWSGTSRPRNSLATSLRFSSKALKNPKPCCGSPVVKKTPSLRPPLLLRSKEIPASADSVPAMIRKRVWSEKFWNGCTGAYSIQQVSPPIVRDCNRLSLLCDHSPGPTFQAEWRAGWKVSRQSVSAVAAGGLEAVRSRRCSVCFR